MVSNAMPELEPALDMAAIDPRLSLAADASFEACVVASAINPGMLQTCDCCKLAETCVPCTEKDSVNPLFACMMLCCRLVSAVTVAFICANGTPNTKDH